MKKKLIASLITAAVVALMIMPAAFAAPAKNCPLKNLVSGNNASLGQLFGSNGTQSAPSGSTLQSLLNGAGTGTGTPSTCPKKAALNNLLNGSDTGTAATPTTLQDLLSKLGLGNLSTCQQQNNCTSASCPTGNCQSGNCLTVGCTTGTCPNK